MAIFGLFKETQKPVEMGYSGSLDPKWARNKRGHFHTLLDVEPDEVGIRGLGGVFVIWHGGVRPQWVYIGEALDLGGAIEAAEARDDIVEFEVNGKLFVTWSPIVEKFRPGVVLYLTQNLKPVVDNPAAAKEESGKLKAIPVDTPGSASK